MGDRMNETRLTPRLMFIECMNPKDKERKKKKKPKRLLVGRRVHVSGETHLIHVSGETHLTYESMLVSSPDGLETAEQCPQGSEKIQSSK